MAKVNIYQKTWKETFIQVFKLFPMVNDIANEIAGSASDKATLLMTLADIAQWGVPRLPNKADFSIALLLIVAYSRLKYANFFKAIVPTK